MAGSQPILQKQYKDHTVPNAVTSLKEEDLPLNARATHMQPIRNLAVTIQILDEEDEHVIETITGKATGGSISLDSTSIVRRSGSLTLSVDKDLFPAPDSLIWFGKIVRVYAGLKDLSQFDTTYNFLLGTFWIDEGDYSIDQDGAEISINLRDKMSKYEGEQLQYAMKIPVDVPIVDAMKMVMENIGETSFGEMIQADANMVVPYTLEYGVGEDVTTIITALRDMYMDWYCGYDVMGNFEFKQIVVQRQDDVAEPKWRFDSTANDRADLTLSFSEGYNFKNIKNHIIVYGGTNDRTGITPMGEVRITDPASPFNVDAIGDKRRIVTEDKYVTDDQCTAKARFEVWKTSNFQEKADITTVPIYILDANDILEITHPETKQVSRYMLDSFSIGLDVSATMSISAHKLYYVGLEYGAKMIPVVENFVKGINNWGWLSLAEERIKSVYNMIGSGNQLTVRFTEGDLGGTQASVTSYATTKNQTLLIDIIDFENLDPKDENGANGRSNGDYADRVLGHEMFHAVMNDYLGHDMAIEIPEWFKEGMGEFLHGAHERFTSVYTNKTNADKKVALINNAKTLLDGLWTGSSEEYVASYLIAIAIYRLSSDSQWKNLFIRLKSQPNVSLNFLLKLLPIAETNDGVKTKIINELNNMTSVWSMLFNKNETDTGSIGGYYFMNLYGVKLNAEDVFNNANTMTDSIGFSLKFDK